MPPKALKRKKSKDVESVSNPGKDDTVMMANALSGFVFALFDMNESELRRAKEAIQLCGGKYSEQFVGVDCTHILYGDENPTGGGMTGLEILKIESPEICGGSVNWFLETVSASDPNHMRSSVAFPVKSEGKKEYKKKKVTKNDSSLAPISSWSVVCDCDRGEVLSSQAAPDAFLRKAKSMLPFESVHTSSSMFVSHMLSFSRFPCSLVLADVADLPVSLEAIDCMEKISTLLGPLGEKEGFYGAGGGPLHLLYLGKFIQHRAEAATADGTTSSFPPLASLLKEVMQVSPPLLPDQFPWVASVDAGHQWLFPRTSAEVDGREDLLKVIYETLDICATSTSGSTSQKSSSAAGDCIRVNAFPYTVPSHCLQQFPYMSSSEGTGLLFVQPFFSDYHSGNCPVACPRDNSMCVERVGPTATGGGEEGEECSAQDLPLSGSISESPAFAFWQLSTGEIMAICNWDYRD